MYASISSAVLLGSHGHPVTVEVQVTRGLPGFNLVGLPDSAVRESRDRARAAVTSSGLDWPGAKVTVNLAPSSDRKTGSGLDLAIAVGVLAANGTVDPADVRGVGFLGELGLDGTVRCVEGLVPLVAALDVREVVVAAAGMVEAGVAARGTVRPVADLAELVAALDGRAPWPDPEQPPAADDHVVPVPDLADVHGQPLAREALELSAAGGHHTLFVGPPGAGKTMLASRLPGLLPDLDREGALEATMIHSAAGVKLPRGGLVTRPPMRAPHHTTSRTALVGGGSRSLRPGEISLAHRGVLFMDEFAEFAPSVLDGLRQPLEERMVSVDRAEIRALVPADFLLVAAMNPCPCGGGPPGSCQCTDAALHRYARRVSGPLLDRFDLRVNVHRPAIDDLLANEPGEPTAVVAARVAAARQRALDRQGVLNSRLGGDDLERHGRIDGSAALLLRHEIEHDRLSGRGYHRVRRVARTVADLRGDTDVTEHDVAIALRFRASLTAALTIGRAS